MALTPGTRLGVYEITAQIGAGGMGQVYRARDTKLNRGVALKILPDLFASDPDRLGRFTREAQTLASLNHPNIAHIHGLEESGGVRALVMELVEGDDLSQRIARGAIPIDEALPIARQIAEALEAAHEQGIIHRDLKPANIKVRPDGTVKVLDFGLAKAMEPTGALSSSVSMSPTITTPAMTQAGVILGTAAYMSPEQARGKAVDKRADIWAFGCVLFEMVTGRRPFDGEDTTEVLGAVVRLEPHWDALPPEVPPPVRTLLHSCLAKDPRQRVADISIALFVLDKTASLAVSVLATSAAPAPSQTPRGRLVWIAALTVAVVVIVALAIPTVQYLRQTPPPETRTEIVTPATDSLASFALSPDGRQIVFVASSDDASRLWLRSLATTTAQPLAGTEGARLPFWSPDSRSIGFFAAGALKRLDLGGGAARTLSPAISGRGGTWHADGVIVFAPSTTTPLMRVSASGGDAVAVTTLGPRQQSHRAPQLLPDGRRFLFYAQGAPDTAGIYLGALDRSPPTRLTPADSAGMFLHSEWLLWVRAGTLMAQRLDIERAALTGEPMMLADGVAVDDALGLSAVSVGATGLVAYRTGAGSRRQLTWLDRSGKALGTIGDTDGNNLANPRLSPDGHRVAVNRTLQGNVDIWLMDSARTSRLTFDAALDLFPVWSPDGTRIVFRSNRTDQADLYEKRTSGAEERLVASNQLKTPLCWSADGRFFLYLSIDPQTNADLWVVPMVGDRTPWVFLKTPFRETNGAFSPDGQWVAYQSNESGRPEIYVRPLVPPDVVGTAMGTAAGQWQISTAGGIMPAWRPDGKELYYLDPSGALMAAPITITRATLEPGAPVVLFRTRILYGGVDVQQWRQYDVASDGRFLIDMELDNVATPITLLMNWNPDSRK